ncbi:Asr1405/Asl0597 family protein [Calothrix rhizosoleniae]|uniref:Asr1405/Asl0597 family protein n=1 Tax=Calothrix rhizosoleniae TaxID=888997 RepID=UPI000B498883|nr:Asr1405/Asl0597 family protein [Calothrix rhizosoleniae]
MEVNLEKLEEQQVIEVDWLDRWLVYKRLQELEIPCSCEMNQPLTVQISNPVALIQVWSVIRHSSASRQQLIRILEKSWQQDL